MRGKLLEALKKVRDKSKERKFTQAVDLIITLKNYDMKKEGNIEDYIRLPKMSKKAKVCALVGREMKDLAKDADKIVFQDSWAKLEPRAIRKLAREFDFFIAQATLMPEVAKKFGKYLAAKGKMPNPKAGQIVPPTVSLTPLVEKFRETIKVRAIKSPVASTKIGDEKMSDEELAENGAFVIEQLIHKLPQGKNNINKILLKTTMSKPVEVKV